VSAWRKSTKICSDNRRGSSKADRSFDPSFATGKFCRAWATAFDGLAGERRESTEEEGAQLRFAFETEMARLEAA
jgi:hypothetical protein